MFSLGEPYKSVDEAFKAKRNTLLGICFVLAVQSPLILFFWWISVTSTASQLPASPFVGSLFYLIFAVILYVWNWRLAASLLLAYAIFDFVATMAVKISVTGSFAPPAMGLIMLAITAQLAIVVFKTHAFQKAHGTYPARSKWVLAGIIVSVVTLLATEFVPAIHFRNYTGSSSLDDIGGFMAYKDSLDLYGFDFSKSWGIRSVPMVYGAVEIGPIYPNTPEKSAIVRVERWTPWDVAPIALFKKEAFLKMAQDEATKYSTETKATVEKVELIGPEKSNINAARAIYVNTDGSKRYVYYYYDRAWERAKSKSAWFFWRVVADIPKGAPNDEAEFEWMIRTFRINGFDVDSDSTLNIEQTRMSFAFFGIVQQLEKAELRE